MQRSECTPMGSRLAKRRGIPCSRAHSEKGEWEGHDEREEQTREEEGEARGSHTTGAFLLTACHGTGICPNLCPPPLEVTHRAPMLLRDCGICTTFFPENVSFEICKEYSIQRLRKARVDRSSM